MSDNAPTTARASHWSLTINNPTANDEEEIARARQKGWKVDGQLEKGKDGTPHYQLHLTTPQVRFSTVKKAFTRAHIEVARNVQALDNYVKKEETREGALPTQSEFYPSLSRFWVLLVKELEARNWLDWDEDRWYLDAYRDLAYPEELMKRKECREEFAHLVFTECVSALIAQGYHVEHFYSPPNISCFKKFHFSIIWRTCREIRAQTTRQTDTRSDVDDSSVTSEHTPDAISEVQVPTLPPPPPPPCPSCLRRSQDCSC